jgi:hypothetical protein
MCKQCSKVAAAAYRQRKLMGICRLCGKNPAFMGNTLCKSCAELSNERKKENTRKRKASVFSAYGGKCGCQGCSEANPKLLTIDHKNNDGAIHRRATKFGTDIYMWIIRNNFPDVLQLRCWNCNIGRHHNGGLCPHLEHENVSRS